MTKSLYDHCIERNKTELLSQWVEDKNGELTPHNVSYGSQKKIWWRCERGHEWQAALFSRTSRNAGCPYCKGKRLDPAAGTLATNYPELVEQWHPTKNIDLTPSQIFPFTHRKVWWLCEEGHEWLATVNSRARGSGCPICTHRKILIGTNDLATTHPELATQWHPTKNEKLKPEMVFSGSTRKVWWQCEHGHEWQATLHSRSAAGSGCPVCEGKHVIAGVNDLATLFPKVAAQWDYEKNGPLTPQEVTAFSNRKVWWKCGNNHSYASLINYKTARSTDCPYCTNRKVLPGFNDLESREPAIASQWHPELNGELTPQMVTTGSSKKIWWQCAYGHVWKAIVYSRTGADKCGCPICAGRIKANHPVEIEI